MTRLEQLKQFIKEDPLDPFNHYALALEYLKTNPAEALNIFKTLLDNHPQYLPTYYPYAQLLAETKESERAEEVFQSGIAAAKEANDLKTMREIQAAYNDWRDSE
jgi:predicted Zn-dependent protease